MSHQILRATNPSEVESAKSLDVLIGAPNTRLR
jgi:hypothetical protein